MRRDNKTRTSAKKLFIFELIRQSRQPHSDSSKMDLTTAFKYLH